MYNVYLEGSLIYSTSRVELQRGMIIKSFRLKVQKAGSFEFTVHPTHPAYNYFEPLVSEITVTDDEEEIFRGRVLRQSTTFYGERTVTCEGNLAYLNDSVMPSVEDTTESVESFFRRCIETHNAQVEAWKQFDVGDVTIDAKSQSVTFKKTGYQTVLSAIENELLRYYGGFLRTRHEGQTTYIDYIENYDSYLSQPIQFSVNLLDLTEDANTEEIYTIMVPVGKDNLTIESENDGSPLLVNESLVNKYGTIYKPESFSDIDDPFNLKLAAEAKMNRDVLGFTPKYSCKALDLHLMYPSLDKLLVGYNVHVLSQPQDVDVEEMILSADIDIQNPENSTYEIGTYSQNREERKTLSSQESGSAQTATDTANKAAAVTSKNAADTAKNFTEVRYELDRSGEKITDNAKKISLIATDEELAQIQAGDISSIYSQSRLELEATQSSLYTNAQKITDTGVALMTAGVFNSITERKDENGKVIGYDVDSNLTAKKIEVDTVGEKVDLTQSKLLEAGVFNHIDSDGSIHTELVAKKSVVDATQNDIEKTKRTLVEAGVYADIDADGDPTVVNKVIVDGKVVTAINASKEGVKIDAKKVDLGDYATVALLESDYLKTGMLGAEISNIAALSVQTLVVEKSTTVHNLYVSPGNDLYNGAISLSGHSHDISCNSSGTVTIGSARDGSSPGSFNIADTSYYKNHVGVRSVGAGTASLVSNEWGGWDYNVPITAYGNDNSSIDRTITISANDAVAQGVYNYYNSYGNWDYPRWDNNWKCNRPNSNNTGTEVWFTMSDVLPDVVGWTWSWDTNTRIRCTLEICGKRYTDYYDT